MSQAKQEIERLDGVRHDVMRVFVDAEALSESRDEHTDEVEYGRHDETKVGEACRILYGRRKRGEIDASKDELGRFIDDVVVMYGLKKSA